MASTTCGRCGAISHMKPITGDVEVSTYWGIFTEGAFTCDNCQRLNMLSRFRPTRSNSGPAGSEWLPRHLEAREFADVPSPICEAATEVTLCFSAGAYRAVGSLARAVIEATAKERGATGGSLAARIDALHESNLVRLHTKEQAHEVRHFGNEMAHGDFADPITREEAEEVMTLMIEVMDEVYQSPARLARRKAARLAKEE